MMEKPTPPGEYECCEGGCEPCVWDLYYEDLARWKAEQAAQSSGDPSATHK